MSVIPRNLRPTRLSRRPEPFDSADFIYELKIDGFRSLAYIESGQCDLVSRNGNTFRNFKDVAQWIGENLRVVKRLLRRKRRECCTWITSRHVADGSSRRFANSILRELWRSGRR